jgi:mRNA interferase YafQ
MLKIEFTGQFLKDYKLPLKRGLDQKKLEKAITIILNEKALPAKYRDHALLNSRNYKGVRDSRTHRANRGIEEILQSHSE